MWTLLICGKRAGIIHYIKRKKALSVCIIQVLIIKKCWLQVVLIFSDWRTTKFNFQKHCFLRKCPPKNPHPYQSTFYLLHSFWQSNILFCSHISLFDFIAIFFLILVLAQKDQIFFVNVDSMCHARWIWGPFRTSFLYFIPYYRVSHPVSMITPLLMNATTFLFLLFYL